MEKSNKKVEGCDKVKKELLELVSKNPELPVVPMTCYEVVIDDHGYWMGSFESAEVREYCCGEEGMHFRDNDDLDETLEDVIGLAKYEEMSDDEARRAFEGLPWTRAIVVLIGLPSL